MSPLDATNPRELFGDAVDDLRALKRAYAKLIRAHPPEQAPETFAHIRALYEQARAELERPAVSSGLRVLSDSPIQGIDQVFESLEPSDWRSAVEQIDRLIELGQVEVLPYGYALLAAMAPDQAFDWLRGHAHRDGGAGLIGECLWLTFTFLKGRARDPALDRLLDALPPTVAREYRLERLLNVASFHPIRAADLWRRDLSELISEPGLARRLLIEGLPGIRWHLRDEELEALLDQAEDARIDLADGELSEIRDLIFSTLQARSYRGPHAVAVCRALEAGQCTSPLSTLVALRELVLEVDDVVALMERLSVEAPAVYSALTTMTFTTSRQPAYLLSWAEDRIPDLPDEREDRWLDEVWHELDRVAESVAVPEPERQEPPIDLRVAWFFVFCLLPSLILGIFSVVTGVFMCVTFLALAVFAAWDAYKVQRLQRVHLLGECEDLHRQEVLRASIPVLAEMGYWPHEVVAASHERYGESSWSGLSALFTGPELTLSCLTDAHVRRLHSSLVLARARADQELAESDEGEE